MWACLPFMMLPASFLLCRILFCLPLLCLLQSSWATWLQLELISSWVRVAVNPILFPFRNVLTESQALFNADHRLAQAFHLVFERKPSLLTHPFQEFPACLWHGVMLTRLSLHYCCHSLSVILNIHYLSAVWNEIRSCLLSQSLGGNCKYALLPLSLSWPGLAWNDFVEHTSQSAPVVSEMEREGPFTPSGSW